MGGKQWRVDDGRAIHDGDCNFWTLSVCTCGLLHHLLPQTDIARWVTAEHAMQEEQLDKLREIQRRRA